MTDTCYFKDPYQGHCFGCPAVQGGCARSEDALGNARTVDLVDELKRRGATVLAAHEVYIGFRHFRYEGTYRRPMTVLSLHVEQAPSDADGEMCEDPECPAEHLLSEPCVQFPQEATYGE